VIHERLSLVALQSEDFGSDDQIVLSSERGRGSRFQRLSVHVRRRRKLHLSRSAPTEIIRCSWVCTPRLSSGPGVYLSPIGVVMPPISCPLPRASGRASCWRCSAPVWLRRNIDPDPGRAAISDDTRRGRHRLPSTASRALFTGSARPLCTSRCLTRSLVTRLRSRTSRSITTVFLSNTVQLYLTDAVPGSFSQGADGIGYAAATHTNGQLITPGNPVQPNENITLYLTGLGTVHSDHRRRRRRVIDDARLLRFIQLRKSLRQTLTTTPTAVRATPETLRSRAWCPRWQGCTRSTCSFLRADWARAITFMWIRHRCRRC